MQRIQDNTDFKYIATPTNVDYPIEDNEVHSTYDQFIQLRDTLIFSGKYYNDKAWAKLIVWASKETIEVIRKNRFKLSFEPWYSSDVENLVKIESEWPYVTWFFNSTDPTDMALATRFWPLSCRINQDWHFLIAHKEEIWAETQISDNEKPIPTTARQVHCYVNIYRKQADWTYPANPTYEVAVFDRYAFAEKTFSWTTSWTDPNGSCSVKVSFTLGDIFRKLTSFWYNERDLEKDDILVLKCVDQTWTELPYQSYSNFLQVQYIDLPLGNWN